MADPRSPQGPVLPPHMLGQAPAFHVPRPQAEPRQPGRTLGGSDILTGLLLAAVNATASGAVPGVPGNQGLANRSGDMLRREWGALLQDPAMQQVLDPSMTSVQTTNPLTGQPETIANPGAPFMLLSSLFANTMNQGNRIGSDADIRLYDPGLTYEEVFQNAGHPDDIAKALAGMAGVTEPGFGELGQLMRGVGAAAPAAVEVLKPVVRNIQEGMARRAAAKRLQRYLRDNPDTHSGNYTTVTLGDGTTVEVPTDWLPPEMHSGPGIAAGSRPTAQFPLTELGQPTAPAPSTLINLAATDEASAAAWLRAWGVDDTVAADTAFFAARISDEAQAERLLRQAYATIEDPNIASELSGMLDPFRGVTTPDPRLYGEREMQQLKPVRPGGSDG